MAKVTMPTAKELEEKSLSVAVVKQIALLVKRQITLEAEIKEMEAALAAKNKQLYRLTTTDIPTAMSEAGVKELTLEDGTEVKVEAFINGYIKEENRDKAHAWLRKNGFGSLIKTSVSCAFGMGDDKKVAALVKFMLSKKLPFDQKEAVHVQTLRAFVRERLKDGKALPPSIDVTEVPTSKINRKKVTNHG